MTIFLLSMEASGMVVSLWEKGNKQELIRQGRELEKAGLSANLESLNYEYEEASLASMQDLRKNLSSQIAINAAKGGGGEAAVGATQKAISNQSADERVRRMNLLAKEANLRANNVLSGLHTLQSETQLGRETADVFTSFPTSTVAEEFRRSDLGKKWGFAPKSTGAPYGLKSV